MWGSVGVAVAKESEMDTLDFVKKTTEKEDAID